MPDKTYRVRIEENSWRFVPDPRSDTPAGNYKESWKDIAHVEGTGKLVADALRSLANQLDPPKPILRGTGPKV
jgi:hypothetical protein